uniref:Uncharacterized protein n=1 Tax=Rhizophora mucronata TaxID=61149 RepID=A0A2P2LLF9_RHIMU
MQQDAVQNMRNISDAFRSFNKHELFITESSTLKGNNSILQIKSREKMFL